MTRLSAAWTFAAVVGSAVIVSAQAGTAGHQTPASRTSTGGSLTVAGCLEGGPAATTTSPRPFVLRDTTPSSGGASVTGGPAPGGTTGTTAGPGTAAGSSSGKTTTADKPGSTPSYVLDGFDTELAQHVGHRIEVTGTLASTTSTSGTGSAAAAATGASSAGRTDSTAAGLPRLQVTGVRMIGSTCAGR